MGSTASMHTRPVAAWSRSPGKGQGLHALWPFHVGDLLFSCLAYACVLTVGERGHHCECCFARKEGWSKCGRCKHAFYCDVECQKEDWPLHKLECSSMVVFGENWNPSETVQLTARILAKVKVHPERTPSEKLLAVREFESHLDKLDNEKKDLIQSDIEALHQLYSKHLEFLDHGSLMVLFTHVNYYNYNYHY